MKKQYIEYQLIIFIATCSFTGCKKFVSIPPPLTQAESKVVFDNENAAMAAVAGLYSQMAQTSLTFANAASSVYPALSADELWNTAANTDYDAFRTNEINDQATGLPRLWQFGYRLIYHTNAVMEGLRKSTSINPELRNQLHGEMLIVRSFCYFHLVNLFGDIPLVLSTNFEITGSQPRTPVNDIYDQLQKDITEAVSLLPESNPGNVRTRPVKYAAHTLLARLHLFRQNWNEAEQRATEVINSGQFMLSNNLNTIFETSSKEAIWQLSSVSTLLNTSEGSLFIPATATARPAFAATPSLLSAIETDDQRKSAWLAGVTVSGIQYAYPFKYKVRRGEPPYKEYTVLMRLAEVYLIRAEALAQQDKLDQALVDLNIIRKRAGLPEITNDNKQEILLAIEQERRIELMFEWGHRWNDLKRTGKADQVLSVIKAPYWEDTDKLYPIPRYELESNPFLYQNPGY